jgi:glycosyltransferase involved in cell wall biosynthesis
MMRLFIHGLAASAGGGLTYLRNVIPHLARTPEIEASVLLPIALRQEFADAPNLAFIEAAEPPGALRRIAWEQTKIPELVRRSRAEVLLCTGNLSLWNSPVPQILLSRNSLYTSADFQRDLRNRGDYFLWADTWLKGRFARQSVLRADVTVAPSNAFAEEIVRWTGKEVKVIHHGFDCDAFVSNTTPLPDNVQRQLDEANDALRLLFVSHYNYYRNFETLIRALPLLRDRLQGKRVKLFLTCRLNSKDNPGRYRAESAASLVSELHAGEEVMELGTIPYGSLHHLYRACHIYVSPAYTETFAHPLVEAMSSGLPLVVSDLPVHREIGGDAALYFPRFSPEALADCIVQIHGSPRVASQLSTSGLRRAQDFSWAKHVQQLLALAEELVRSKATTS